MTFENKINELGIELPEAKAPVGSYVATKTVGKLLFISGQISIEQVSNQNMSGTFSCTMLKPVLSWPLSEIVIENGEFYYEPIDLQSLSNDKDVIIARNVELGLAYPNPFNPVTHIPYDVNLGQNINISIFDLNGKKIKSLINKFHQPGKYKLSFNAKELSSGIYFISFQNSNYF